jgi:arginyl-tRNA synthetase
MIEEKVRHWIETALVAIQEKGLLPLDNDPNFLPSLPFSIEIPKEKKHGDLSTNVGMVLAKKLKTQPRLVASTILENLPEEAKKQIRGEIAGPGFLNFFFFNSFFHESLLEIEKKLRERSFSSLKISANKILLEFVSANPTGPLNVVNARAAAVGDTLARIFETLGKTADREFYVNDEGSQIENLARSVEARYKELLGEPAKEFPEDWYAGEYVKEISCKIRDGFGENSNIFQTLGRNIYGSKIFSDERLQQLQKGFGEHLFEAFPSERERLEFLGRTAVVWNVFGQKNILEKFGVSFQNWYFQSQLGEKLAKAIAILREKGHVYEKDGAVWFASTSFGDDKDRVLIRQDGSPTYFAADIAYHAYKKEKGYDLLIDLLGPDHHGYIARTKAAVQALGYPANCIEIYIIQLVTLMSCGKPVRMSKRAGEFITMEELLEDVGVDAGRWYFLTRHRDSPLDFDLDLAKLQSEENPLYYAQYAHARICSILRKGEEQGIKVPQASSVDLSPLTHDAEKELIKKMGQWPFILELAAQSREPHHLPRYALELARAFHAFYTQCPVLYKEEKQTAPITLVSQRYARLFLVDACRKLLAHVLSLMGISAPEKM